MVSYVCPLLYDTQLTWRGYFGCPELIYDPYQDVYMRRISMDEYDR
jgi:hypothetical protein